MADMVPYKPGAQSPTGSKVREIFRRMIAEASGEDAEIKGKRITVEIPQHRPRAWIPYRQDSMFSIKFLVVEPSQLLVLDSEEQESSISLPEDIEAPSISTCLFSSDRDGRFLYCAGRSVYVLDMDGCRGTFRPVFSLGDRCPVDDESIDDAVTDEGGSSLAIGTTAGRLFLLERAAEGCAIRETTAPAGRGRLLGLHEGVACIETRTAGRTAGVVLKDMGDSTVIGNMELPGTTLASGGNRIAAISPAPDGRFCLLRWKRRHGSASWETVKDCPLPAEFTDQADASGLDVRDLLFAGKALCCRFAYVFYLFDCSGPGNPRITDSTPINPTDRLRYDGRTGLLHIRVPRSEIFKPFHVSPESRCLPMPGAVLQGGLSGTVYGVYKDGDGIKLEMYPATHTGVVSWNGLEFRACGRKGSLIRDPQVLTRSASHLLTGIDHAQAFQGTAFLLLHQREGRPPLPARRFLEFHGVDGRDAVVLTLNSRAVRLAGGRGACASLPDFPYAGLVLGPGELAVAVRGGTLVSVRFAEGSIRKVEPYPPLLLPDGGGAGTPFILANAREARTAYMGTSSGRLLKVLFAPGAPPRVLSHLTLPSPVYGLCNDGAVLYAGLSTPDVHVVLDEGPVLRAIAHARLIRRKGLSEAVSVFIDLDADAFSGTEYEGKFYTDLPAESGWLRCADPSTGAEVPPEVMDRVFRAGLDGELVRKVLLDPRTAVEKVRIRRILERERSFGRAAAPLGLPGAAETSFTAPGDSR